MKIKHQLSIFNALTRLIIVLILWFSLPVLIEKVIYHNTDKDLAEKKYKFIKQLDKEEINEFILRGDKTETYASFSTLHTEFLQLSKAPKKFKRNASFFSTDSRIIEDEETDYRILQYDFKYEKMNYRLEIGSSLSEIKELTYTIRLFILVVLFIILVITFLMDTFFIEYLLKPFYKIIETKIKRVNEPDIFDHTPIQTHSADFQELDSVLNQMMFRINELFKKEKQFIANVSHELLTPIAILNNKFENLLQNSSLDNDAIDKTVGALRTLATLKKIINNLLLISRIENKQYQTNETIFIEEIIVELKEDFVDRLEEKELDFSITIDSGYSFLGNKILVRILLFNLIINAIKYNNRGGSIKIFDTVEDETYSLFISDNGIGMNEIQINEIFNRFTQLNAEQEGHGLGLAIVESIAHFHEIKIKVNSVSTQGTTFQLIFTNKTFHK